MSTKPSPAARARIIAKVKARHQETLSRSEPHNAAAEKDSAGSKAPQGRSTAGVGADPVGAEKLSKAIVLRGARPIATLAEFENLGPANADPGARFALVNEYHDLARTSMAQSCAYMILAGVELLALKEDAEHGTWEKLFPEAGAKSANAGAFAMPLRTAQRYMGFAAAAKKHVPALRESCASNVPLSLMSPEAREKIVHAVRKTGDGNTYSDLAKEWGIAKKPPGNGGGQQQSGEDSKLTPQQQAEQGAQDLFHPIAVSLFQGASEGEQQKLYHLPITSDAPGDVTGLADLADHTRAFLRIVEAVLEDKKKAARKGAK